MGSKRLPGKVMSRFNGKTLLELITERLRGSHFDQLWIATTVLPEDDVICELATLLSIPVFRGDVNNVLSRFIGILENDPADWVVRITADNPLIHFESTNILIQNALNSFSCEYMSDFLDRKYPLGAVPEIVKVEALMHISSLDLAPHHKSHVTSFIWRYSQNAHQLKLPETFLERPNWRWTLDVNEDLIFFRNLGRLIGKEITRIDYRTLCKILDENPHLANLNSKISQKSLEEG